jgi:hypothetical protein
MLHVAGYRFWWQVEGCMLQVSGLGRGFLKLLKILSKGNGGVVF